MDRYAVAITRSGVVMGHLTRSIFKGLVNCFRREGTLYCIDTGTRRYSADLPKVDWRFHVFYTLKEKRRKSIL